MKEQFSGNIPITSEDFINFITMLLVSSSPDVILAPKAWYKEPRHCATPTIQQPTMCGNMKQQTIKYIFISLLNNPINVSCECRPPKLRSKLQES
jgi:hypothetical protein